MKNIIKIFTYLFCCLWYSSASSDVWLSPSGFLKSEAQDQSPKRCQIQSVMQTEQGPLVGFNKIIVFDKSIGGAGVMLSSAVQEQSGETIPLVNFSRNTSSSLSEWKYMSDTEFFALLGQNATQYLIDYTGTRQKFLGWVLDKNSFEPARDFIFLFFKMNDKNYHAPLFLGDGEFDFDDCVQKSLKVYMQGVK